LAKPDREPGHILLLLGCGRIFLACYSSFLAAGPFLCPALSAYLLPGFGYPIPGFFVLPGTWEGIKIGYF
jgi:hypothetical protein